MSLAIVIGVVAIIAVVGLVVEKVVNKKGSPTTITPTAPKAVSSAVTSKSLTYVVAGVPVDLNQPQTSTPDQLAIIKAGEAKIAAWGKASINWSKVTAGELTVIYQTAIKAATNTVMDYANGKVWVIDGVGNVIPGIPSPNFEIQGRVLRGEATTESERAYVWHNNVDQYDVDSLNNKFQVDGAGNVTAR